MVTGLSPYHLADDFFASLVSVRIPDLVSVKIKGGGLCFEMAAEYQPSHVPPTKSLVEPVSDIPFSIRASDYL